MPLYGVRLFIRNLDGKFEDVEKTAKARLDPKRVRNYCGVVTTITTRAAV